MKTKRINFTEKTLATLPLPAKNDGQAIYYDSGTSDGLQLIVTYGGSKTYYFYALFQGRPIRDKIGKVGQIKLVQAREIAHSKREQINKGIDPTLERKAALQDITLKDFYENHYKPQHSQLVKAQKSIKDDDGTFYNYLKELHSRHLRSINHDDIAKLHTRLFREISPYTANRMLSLIRHMYNKAAEWGNYSQKLDNPTNGIKKFPEKSRDRFMNGDELHRFFSVLYKEPDSAFKFYILLSLFLGQRRRNILALRWSDVDLNNKLVYFRDTKNKEPLQVPLTSHAIALFKYMKENAVSEWVLPSATSASGHYEEPKKPWKKLLAAANIDNLRLHDLRRTLGSYQAISGASLAIIGKSLGHKSQSATEVYSRLSVDPVRDSMQKATDMMLEFMK